MRRSLETLAGQRLTPRTQTLVTTPIALDRDDSAVSVEVRPTTSMVGSGARIKLRLVVELGDEQWVMGGEDVARLGQLGLDGQETSPRMRYILPWGHFGERDLGAQPRGLGRKYRDTRRFRAWAELTVVEGDVECDVEVSAWDDPFIARLGFHSSIAFDAASGGNATEQSSITFSHTVAAGDDRKLIVTAGGLQATGTVPSTSTVTYNTVGMTEREDASQNGAVVDLNCSGHDLADPAVTTANVVVTFNTTHGAVHGFAASYTGMGDFIASNSGSGDGSSLSSGTVTLASGELAVGGAHCADAAITEDGGQTSRGQIDAYYLGSAASADISEESGTGSVGLAWTQGSTSGFQEWAAVIMAYEEAAVGGGLSPAVAYHYRHRVFA